MKEKINLIDEEEKVVLEEMVDLLEEVTILGKERITEIEKEINAMTNNMPHIEKLLKNFSEYKNKNSEMKTILMAEKIKKFNELKNKL